MGTIPNDKSAGESLSATEANKIRDIGLHPDLLAGENITGPQAAYIKASDSKLYKCDANDQLKLEFAGFVINSPTSGSACQLQMNGIVGGFSSLTAGAKYYVQDDGTIGTSVGTYEIYVGIAVSTTEILIMYGSEQYIGTQSLANGANTITSDIQDKWKKVIIVGGGTGSGANTGEITLYKKGKVSGSFIVEEGGAPNFSVGYTASVSGTTITLAPSGNSSGSSGTAYYYR